MTQSATLSPFRRAPVIRLDAVSKSFRLPATGASSTHNRHGLDRHWRNAAHTCLHDPVAYKIATCHALLDQLPEPTPYS